MDVNKLYLTDVVMKTYAGRLKSYENWPSSFMDPEEAAGFYYTGYGDLVRCPFCKVLVGYWKTGDRPVFEHRCLSLNCAFAYGHISNDPNAPVECGCGYKF
jgi:hypothetical protein